MPHCLAFYEITSQKKKSTSNSWHIIKDDISMIEITSKKTVKCIEDSKIDLNGKLIFGRKIDHFLRKGLVGFGQIC